MGVAAWAVYKPISMATVGSILYLANDSGPNFLYHNQRDGRFKEIGFSSGVAVGEDGQEQGSMGIAVGDYLHDGRMAFFITNFSSEYDSLYLPESG
jgi:hypothetical protein